MIEFKYTPWKLTFADASEPSPVQDLTMTLRDGISWEEAIVEFQNFLRAAGYVIPYDFEYDCEPLQKLTDWEETYRPEEFDKTTKHNDHPDAPHGFDRGASHSAGRYVCECEGWEPEAVKPFDQ